MSSERVSLTPFMLLRMAIEQVCVVSGGESYISRRRTIRRSGLSAEELVFFSGSNGPFHCKKSRSGPSYGPPAASLLFSRTIFICDFWLASTLISAS